MDFVDVPKPLLARARKVALALPEAGEARRGVRTEFKIRQRTFAHVFTISDPPVPDVTMLVCRADPDEREVLRAIGHPYFVPRTGVDRIGIVIDGSSDWSEIAELITESYRLLAPRKLADQIDGLPPGARS